MRLRLVQFTGTLIAGLVAAAAVSGQGIVTFSNLTGINNLGPAIYDIDGRTPLTGPGFLAELYAGAPGGSLQPVPGSITPFLTGVAAGYFFNSTDVPVPGLSYFATATVQVVAWRASDGSTFADANHLGGHVGASSPFNVVLGCNSLPSCGGAILTGLQSFSLSVVVPEPPVSLLGLLGAGTLIFWRRVLKF